MSMTERTVLLAGATSPSGLVITRALVGAGARVIAVGRDQDKLDALAVASRPTHPSGSGSVRVERCSLTNETEVAAVASRLASEGERVDGLIPLVGGWRGGNGLAGQTEEDYRALEQAFTVVRVTSRAFDPELRASPAGRFAVISSTAVARPLAGGANYAAVKAASEAWTHAVAQGFAKAARDAEQPLHAAAVVIRVRGLDAVIDAVASRIVGLWQTDAAELNDRVFDVL